MKLEHHGLSVQAAPGWDARIYRRTGAEATYPIMHAADFPLPADRGDYGSGAVEVMKPSNVFLSLVQFGPDDAGAALFAKPRPSRLLPEEFGPERLQRLLPGQAGAQYFFAEGGRPFCLYVVIGSYRDRLTLVPRASAMFQAMEVA